MIIGLCGITFFSVNYGVSALAYSQISLIHSCASELGVTPKYYVFSMDDESKVKDVCSTLGIEDVCVYESARFRPGLAGLIRLEKRIKQCDIVFDLTKGDSFSDIYGYGRFILQAFEKYFAIKKSRLVISPQTIGPFDNYFCRKVAKYFIKNAAEVYARDSKSEECVKQLVKGKQVTVTSDLAFYLPFVSQPKRNKDGKKHIGVNVSGLLWNGGYTGHNEFGLKCDYKKYTIELIKVLLSSGNFTVHLIAHVYMESGDDDYKVCEELKKQFPTVVLSPKFRTPMEAKSYFSSLDVLVGARMHATIGAISSGIVCIPVSYSRKFEGLYSSIGYPYVIEATKWSTDKCLSETLKHIDNADEINIEAQKAVGRALQINESYKRGIKKYLSISEGDHYNG